MQRVKIKLLLLLIMLFINSCITSQPSKFYIITPAKYNAKSNFISPNIILGLGPVSIAKYLDRSQLVVRLTPNQIKLEDFHQWAGSPRDDIPAVIFENLSNILGTDTIYKYPWTSHVNVDYQIVMEILQLDGRPDKDVRVAARWEIIKGGTLKTVKVGKADFIEPVSNGGENIFSGNLFDSFVEAQSRAIGKLSLMVAKSFIELHK